MTLEEANKLLDAAREGQPIPYEVIAQALSVTGDVVACTEAPCPDIEAFLVAMRSAGVL